MGKLFWLTLSATNPTPALELRIMAWVFHEANHTQPQKVRERTRWVKSRDHTVYQSPTFMSLFLCTPFVNFAYRLFVLGRSRSNK